MPVIQAILEFLDYQITTPKMYGAFHIVFLVLTVAAAITLCVLWDRGIINNVRNVVLITAVVVLVFEIYKQINFTFGYKDGLSADYQWYAFPWQFCSTPLYIGLIAGLTKGKPHDYLCSYLATYAFFAGTAVMLYPSTVFTSTLGINIQTMICHGSMIVIAVFLYYTEHVRPNLSTLLKAIPVFVMCLSVAVLFNELYHLAWPDGETFNMFFVSRHYESDLPVYSLVHNWIMSVNPSLYPICILLYIIGFTAVAGFMLLLAREVMIVLYSDYDAEYAEIDAFRKQRQEERRERLKALEIERRKEEAIERERRKQQRAIEKERRAEIREEKREEREEKREARRNEEQKERARRKREKQQEREEERREKRERKEEKLEARRRKEREKKKKREEEKRLEKRMKEIEKREKEEKKRAKKEKKEKKKEQKKLKKKQKKLKKQQKKQNKKEKKAEKKALREQEKQLEKDERRAFKEQEKQLRKEEEQLRKEEEKALKKEKKALKKWLKEQKELGIKEPNIEEFYEYYYD